jgi:aspartate/methionine/tyrosine aminotransferase
MTPASQFRNFELELWQSAHEQDVRYELADSGVPAISLVELRTMGLDLESLLELPLHYPEVNGTQRLRERIAALYPTLKADQVLVTVGAAEAGSLVIDALTEAGDRIAFMRPDYQQLTGLARNRRREPVTFSLDPEQEWALNIEQLQRACAPGVRLISLSNPNNPTGKVLSSDERLAVLDVARRHDAWLLADEVYVGTEHDGDETATLLGHYEKTVVISSLSKAYGLSGLRLGWVVGPEAAVAACWRRHEYATIATSALSMSVGEFAVDPSRRAALFDRSRRYIAAGHRAINEWASTTDAGISVTPAKATPVSFVRLPASVRSVEFAQRLVEQASVLVAPGAYFGGFDEHVRITAARNLDELRPALALVAELLRESK